MLACTLKNKTKQNCEKDRSSPENENSLKTEIPHLSLNEREKERERERGRGRERERERERERVHSVPPRSRSNKLIWGKKSADPKHVTGHRP